MTKLKKPKTLFYEYEPYYRVEIIGPNVVIYSDSVRSKGRALKQRLNEDGYLEVTLGKRKRIHQLVAELTLGEKPLGYVVNHIDGNKLNNHPSNLEYCTINENIQHSIKLGFHVANDPKRSGRYKDGRCKDLNAYKLKWYHENKTRLYGRGK